MTYDMRTTADAIRRAEGIIVCTVHVTQRKVAVRPERAMHYAKECYVGGIWSTTGGGGRLSLAARSRGTFGGGGGGGGDGGSGGRTKRDFTKQER